MPHRYVRLIHEGKPAWAQELTPDALALLSDAPWNAPTVVARLPRDGAAPLPPATPTKIVCVGRNYAAHAAELGNDVPREPLLFLKPPSALLGPGGDVRLPPQSERVEHEAELAVVIGQRCGPSAPPGPRAIFGYTIANDVTARDLQRADVQFTRAKSFDTFCPLGPALVSDCDPTNLGIRLWVGDDLRQDERTSAMVFDVPQIVDHVRGIMTLEPGDLILSGTPSGVGPLRHGDQVRIEIEGIGTLEHGVCA